MKPSDFQKTIQTNIGNLNRDITAANRLMQSIRQMVRHLKGWIADLKEKKAALLEALQEAKEPTLPELLGKASLPAVWLPYIIPDIATVEIRADETATVQFFNEKPEETPETPATPAKPEKEVPQTGDDNFIFLYGGLLALAVIGGSVFAVCYFKKGKYEYYHPERTVIQSGPVAFNTWLEKMDCRPYRTEIQLYKSLLFLLRSIDRELIITSQREALQTLRCIISNLEYRFYKAYGMEIEDKRTVYEECTYRLVPREDEPSVCLMHDWIYLPST